MRRGRVQLRQESRDLGGIVLKVAVDGDDDVARGLLEPGLQGGRLAEVAPEPNDADVVVGSVEAGEGREGPVRGAVVDEDDLPRPAQRLECGLELVVQQRDALLLVVYGDDHRDHGR